jgi:PAS domain S-box-containing protein
LRAEPKEAELVARFFDLSLDLLCVIGFDGSLKRVSPSCEHLVGYRPQEVCARRFLDLVHPDDRHDARTELDRLAAGARLVRFENRLLCQDGSTRRLTWTIVSSPEQQLAYGVGRDISERELLWREREIQLLAAQRMQQHLLPDEPPLLPGFDIAGATYPAQFAAGDHYDYLSMPGGCVGVVISDVSGHGFAPALLVASTQTLLRSLADTRGDAGQILTDANAYLTNETADERFVTVFLGRLDPGPRIFSYASAGHPTGYVLRAGGEVKAELDSTSLPLAVLPDTTVPKADPVQLESGDTVVILTDGVMEARSANEESFGSRRALDVIRAHRDRTSREIIDRLYRAVCEFTGGDTLWDDVTAMVVKVGPQP